MTTKEPLNQILYGPPGTGKTYNTIYKALDILDPLEGKKSWSDLESPDANWNKDEHDGLSAREYALDSFNAFKKHGQIVMTTFHQSMSYEDFVEGIMPDVDSEDKDIHYIRQFGIFKQIVENAKEEYINSHKTPEQLDKEAKIQKIVEDYINESEENQIQFTKAKKGVFTIKDGLIIDEEINYQPDTKVIIKNLVTLLCEKNQWEPNECRYTDLKNRFSNSSSNSYISSILPRICKDKSDNLKSTTSEKNENLSSPINKCTNYVLIIDEINRGNVANIFGELITLIEEDKRLGNEEATTVILPYSQKPFGVPNNLYIIGTMNTADRSVEALDSALRRRFSFTEMMPKPDLLKDVKISGVNISNGTDQASLADLLYTINKRIEILKDREHQIGHSYFMKFVNDKKYENGVNAEELREVFYNKIIPLLQEYFYGDYEKIQMVIGIGFVEKDTKLIPFAKTANENDSSSEDLYRIVSEPNMNKALANLNIQSFQD